MADLEVKAKTARFPMGSPKQARSTLSRLTRDLLNGKIDKEKYRAACYGLSVLCGLFKLETPGQMDISIGNPPPLADWYKETPERLKHGIQLKTLTFAESIALETPEERQKRIEELLVINYPEFAEYRKIVKQRESGNNDLLLPEPESQPEPEPVIQQPEPDTEPPELVKVPQSIHYGIGAKRTST